MAPNARRRGRCCIPLGLNLKIFPSPSSASLPRGATSRRATCTSISSEGMKYSLGSREVIADSNETVVGCAGMDGFVAIGGCDKNMPGALIAIARMNRPAVFVYGGTILPGCLTMDPQRKLDVVSV